MTKRSEEDKVFINHLKTALFWISESMDFLQSPNPRRGGLCNSSCRPSDEFSCCFYEAYTTGIVRVFIEVCGATGQLFCPDLSHFFVCAPWLCFDECLHCFCQAPFDLGHPLSVHALVPISTPNVIFPHKTPTLIENNGGCSIISSLIVLPLYYEVVCITDVHLRSY